MLSSDLHRQSSMYVTPTINMQEVLINELKN